MKINIQEVKEYLNNTSKESKIYIGGDSERVIINNVWYADYTLAVVIHINGKNGCKLFGESCRERDFDQKINRPRFRLMNEVYKISELYLKLADVLEGRDVQIHLDINPKETAGSNCVLNEAIGYIKGTCNIIPFVKPEAFAASTAADRIKELRRAA